MVKINGRCQGILTGFGECWFIEVPDCAGPTVEHVYQLLPDFLHHQHSETSLIRPL